MDVNCKVRFLMHEWAKRTSVDYIHLTTNLTTQLPTALKIIQNVAFWLSNFGIFHQFLSY